MHRIMPWPNRHEGLNNGLEAIIKLMTNWLMHLVFFIDQNKFPYLLKGSSGVCPVFS